MTYETYRYIFIIAAILCGVMLAVSVLVFILLRIPKIISDLSGATARKAIKSIREQNEISGDKLHKVSAFNRERGMITDKISASGNLLRQSPAQIHVGIQTTKISTQQLSPETSVLQSGETSVLEPEQIPQSGSGETSVLEQGQTGPLAPESTAGQTSILDQNDAQQAVFEILYEITYTHTDEVIA